MLLSAVQLLSDVLPYKLRTGHDECFDVSGLASDSSTRSIAGVSMEKAYYGGSVACFRVVAGVHDCKLITRIQ